MHGFSIADGFVEISECLAEMIKYVANEPSSGLFFIQQHTQNAVPNVAKLQKNVVENSHETTLHTEDLEDSITVVRSMKECGCPIADEMIGEIKKSLVTVTTKQPKRGLIHQSASNFQREGDSFCGNTSFFSQGGSEKRSNYFSSVFKSAKQKASSFKWSQLEARGSIDSKDEKPQLGLNLPLSVTSASSTSLQGTESDELPLSSQVEDESKHEQTDMSEIGNKLFTSLQGTESDELPLSSRVEDESKHEQTDMSEIGNKLLSESDNYEDLKSNKEAKLEERLEGASKLDDNCGSGDKERL